MRQQHLGCLQVVSAGKIKTVQLSDKVTTGRQQWLQWHADFATRLPALIKVVHCSCALIVVFDPSQSMYLKHAKSCPPGLHARLQTAACRCSMHAHAEDAFHPRLKPLQKLLRSACRQPH